MSDASNEQIEPVLQELNERHSNNDIMEASNVVQAESKIPSAIASTNNNSPGSDTVTHATRMNTGNNMADYAANYDGVTANCVKTSEREKSEQGR